MQHDHDPDIRECNNCGGEYDLSRQNYFGPLCPSCMDEQNPKLNWPICFVCDERIPPDERTRITVRGAARDPSTVRLPVHEDCKSDRSRNVIRGP